MAISLLVEGGDAPAPAERETPGLFGFHHQGSKSIRDWPPASTELIHRHISRRRASQTSRIFPALSVFVLCVARRSRGEAKGGN